MNERNSGTPGSIGREDELLALLQSDGEADEAEVIRREFLRLALQLGGMALLARASIVDEAAGAVQINRRLVDDLELTTRQLACLWDRADPHILHRALRGHYGIVAALADRASPMYEMDLHQLAGRSAAVLGLVGRMIGRQDAAMNHYLAADIHALEAADDHLRALVATWMSDVDSSVQRGVAGPSDERVRGNLDLAEKLAGQSAPPALRTQVYFRQAEEHAAAGEVEEAYRYVDRAEAAWSSASSHEDSLCGLFPWPAEVNRAFTGNVALLAGQHRAAVAILERTLAAMPAEAISNRSSALADLGAAYAQQNEVEHACEMLSEAFRVAMSTGLAYRAQRVVGVLHQHLDTRAHEPAVRRLREVIDTGSVIGS